MGGTLDSCPGAGTIHRFEWKPKRLAIVVRQNSQDGGLPAKVRQKIEPKCAIRRGLGSLGPLVAFAALLSAGCSKTQSASVLGDAAHPTPIHSYTVAAETARRR